MSGKLLTRKEAAKFIGVTVSTLNTLAWAKDYDLPFIKMHHGEATNHCAMYRLSDLEAFLEKRARLKKEACLERLARINEELANLNKEN